MARETAAEKRAREAAERAERDARVWTEFTAQYPVRFANVLFEYATLEYAQFRVVKVDEETYGFYRNYTNATLTVTPPANYNWEYLYSFEQVEDQLREYKAEEAENLRKANVRLNALLKLTAEERKLLDL